MCRCRIVYILNLVRRRIPIYVIALVGTLRVCFLTGYPTPCRNNFSGLSTSGGRAKCFTKLINHQRKLELESAHSAARHAEVMMQREPQAPALAELPSQNEQDKHCLTHVPYKPWCSSCVASRARADRHTRDDSTYAGAATTVSFDFCYTKSVPEGSPSWPTMGPR